MLELRNPHSILAALDVRPKAVRSIQINRQTPAPPWDIVLEAAQRRGVPVRTGGKERPQQGRRRETERSGAGSATVEPPSPVPIGNLWKNQGNDNTGLWLALDQVQDPQNLGAIFRLAGFFGVRGIVMTKDNSAPVNSTVCDVATGGVEYTPYAIVSNLTQALQKAQKTDMWVLGTCERAEESIRTVDRERKWIVVMGNEGDGMRRLTRETCDTLVSLPPLGKVPSLNVAAATSACLTALTMDR